MEKENVAIGKPIDVNGKILINTLNLFLYANILVFLLFANIILVKQCLFVKNIGLKFKTSYLVM